MELNRGDIPVDKVEVAGEFGEWMCGKSSWASMSGRYDSGSRSLEMTTGAVATACTMQSLWSPFAMIPISQFTSNLPLPIGY